MNTQLERLDQLGAVTLADAEEECPDCEVHHQIASLTAAGVPVATELVKEGGIPVAVRADAAGADAAQTADLIGEIPPPEWHADATAWFAAEPDPAEATDALVAEITAESRTPVTVMAWRRSAPWSRSPRSRRSGARWAAPTTAWSCTDCRTTRRSIPTRWIQSGSSPA